MGLGRQVQEQCPTQSSLAARSFGASGQTLPTSVRDAHRVEVWRRLHQALMKKWLAMQEDSLPQRRPRGAGKRSQACLPLPT